MNLSHQRPKVIILPQLLYAVAFLASIYSTTSCNYITANYDYSMEQSYLKSKVGYGMLSRQSASTESDQCHWYSVNDVDSFFDTPFRVAAAASTLATLIGGLNFIYSLFLWCRVVTGSSIRFLCYVTIFCVVCEAITQVIFVTEVCMIDTCSKLPDGTDGSCVRSHCSLGMGSYFAFVALFVWLVCLYVTIRLLQKARRQYEDQKRRIRAINEVAFTDVEDAFDDGGRNIPPVVVDESEKEENDTTKQHKHGKKKEESTSHWNTMLAGFMGDYSTDDGSKIPSTIQI
mmetsp:Transcript_24077/g.30301  ORF Transcript_24077/g.30301 Transcript_24077/m.30301 type:complete len:287 (-) Transcript_24077:534-1394(-)